MSLLTFITAQNSTTDSIALTQPPLFSSTCSPVAMSSASDFNEFTLTPEHQEQGVVAAMARTVAQGSEAEQALQMVARQVV